MGSRKVQDDPTDGAHDLHPDRDQRLAQPRDLRATERGPVRAELQLLEQDEGGGGQGDELFDLRPVVIDWRHREDEPALAEADRLDHDGTAGPGQDDHVTGVDIASKDHILHR